MHQARRKQSQVHVWEDHRASRFRSHHRDLYMPLHREPQVTDSLEAAFRWLLRGGIDKIINKIKKGLTFWTFTSF